MNYKQIRKAFTDFYNSKGYVTHAPSTINCYDGDTLFTIAGMKQFSKFYLGQPYVKPHVLTIQPCIRVDDLDVIKTSNIHSSLFEMLGAFSFTKIHKRFVITNMLEFFESVGINRKNLIATTHTDDDESFGIWQELLGNQVIRLQTNFWSMGEYGVCGPCTELYYNVHNLTNLNEIAMLIQNSSPNMIEIGNSVLMSYNRTPNGLEPLKEKYLDMGLGLSRIACVINGTFNVYKTDIIEIHTLLQENKIVTDSVINACWIMKEGIESGNTGREYVLRKLIRRALFHDLNIPIDSVLNIMARIYDNAEFINKKTFIQEQFQKEKTLFETILINAKKMLNKMYSAAEFAVLHHTYGVPLEIIYMHVNDQEIINDIQKELEVHKNKSKNFAADTVVYNLPTTCTYYDQIACDSTIVFVEQREDRTLIVTQESCFYPRGGGQAGDRGTINNVKVLNTIKKNITFTDIVIIHECEKCQINVSDKVHMKIDVNYRNGNMRAHSGLHLVGEYIIRKLNCKQCGSSVESDRARIDVGAVKSEVDKIIKDAITHANDAIAQKIQTNVRVVPIEETVNALKDGEYSDMVREVIMGEYSDQLCGGTHVFNTGQIGFIRLVCVETKAKGVTRITITTNHETPM
jgi:alanyl-tRNA synthetase